jgi:hypothetical protein
MPSFAVLTCHDLLAENVLLQKVQHEQTVVQTRAAGPKTLTMPRLGKLSLPSCMHAHMSSHLKRQEARVGPFWTNNA